MKEFLIIVIYILNFVLSEEYISYQLENNNFNLYFAKILIGSHEQVMNLVVDTRRPNILVGGSECNKSTCKGQLYQNKSNQFIMKKESHIDNTFNVNYNGTLATDLVNFRNIRINNSEIYIVKAIFNNDDLPVDGLFGLGFPKNKESNLIYNLFKQGGIKRGMYSLNLNSPHTESYIHIGGFDKDYFNETEALSFPVKYSDDDFSEWYMDVEKAKIKGKEYLQTFKIITSTSTNIFKIPKQFFLNEALLTSDNGCSITKYGIFKCRCYYNYTEVYPTFTFFSADGKEINIKPEDYIYNSNDTENGCLVLLGWNYINDYWILGTNFMNDYYTVFDLENDKIMLHRNSKNDVDLDSTFLFVAIIFLSTVIFFVIIHFIYKRIMERREEYNRISN